MGDALEMAFEHDAGGGCHATDIGELARDCAEFIGWCDEHVALEVIVAEEGWAATAGVQNSEAAHGVGERIVGLEGVGHAKDGFGVVDHR